MLQNDLIHGIPIQSPYIFIHQHISILLVDIEQLLMFLNLKTGFNGILKFQQ